LRARELKVVNKGEMCGVDVRSVAQIVPLPDVGGRRKVLDL